MRGLTAVLAVLALLLAACGGGDAPATPTAAPTAAPTADLAAAAARTTRVGGGLWEYPTSTPGPIIGSMEYETTKPTPRPSTPQSTPTPMPIRVTGLGWSQPYIALPAGAYRCTATVRDNLYVNLRGQLAPGVALFQVWLDGKFVTLIDGVRGSNISRYQVIRVRGGLYEVWPSVEDLASWELACSLLAP